MKDITGIQFDKLTPVEPVSQYESNKNYIWLCKCECGNTRIVSENRLQQKQVKCCKECVRKRWHN